VKFEKVGARVKGYDGVNMGSQKRRSDKKNKLRKRIKGKEKKIGFRKRKETALF